MERQFARQLSKILRYRLDIDELIDGRDFEADFALPWVVTARCSRRRVVSAKADPDARHQHGAARLSGQRAARGVCHGRGGHLGGAIASTRGRSSASRRRGGAARHLSLCAQRHLALQARFCRDDHGPRHRGRAVSQHLPGRRPRREHADRIHGLLAEQWRTDRRATVEGTDTHASGSPQHEHTPPSCSPTPARYAWR